MAMHKVGDKDRWSRKNIIKYCKELNFSGKIRENFFEGYQCCLKVRLGGHIDDKIMSRASAWCKKSNSGREASNYFKNCRRRYCDHRLGLGKRYINYNDLIIIIKKN